MMLSERISFGGRRVAGFQLVGIGAQAERLLTYKAGETWELNFFTDQPVSSAQFLSLAQEFQSEPVEIISFMALTETHFRAIVKWLEAGQTLGRFDKEWEGVRYAVTAEPYSEATLPPGGGPIEPTPGEEVPTSREPNPCIPGTGILDPSTGKCVPCPVPSMFDLRTGLCTPVPVAPALPPTPAPPPEEEKKRPSTAAMVGVGVAAAAVGAGIVYVATRKKKRRK